MTWDTAQQIIRIMLQVIGGALISAGYLHSSDLQGFIGAGLSLFGVVWWAIWERKRPESKGGP